jgi:predicted dehydrogenase
MAQREARLKGGIEAVAIVTPNHMHYPAAKEFLKRGIHVICDKPLTATMAEAKAFEKAVASSDAIFCLTHNYTGYPMVRQAKAMVEAGELGPITMIQAEYPKDWLTEPVERTGAKQAEWRTDPKRSGAGALGDIGTHAYNLACFVAGDTASEIAADVHSIVEGRPIDDNAHVMLRFSKGAKGMPG